jgi:hypothetical protein
MAQAGWTERKEINRTVVTTRQETGLAGMSIFIVLLVKGRNLAKFYRSSGRFANRAIGKKGENAVF